MDIRKSVFGVMAGIVLALAMIVGMSATVFAEEPEGTEIVPETSVLTEGTYYLSDDVILNQNLIMQEGDVTINLNNHMLRLSSAADNWQSVIYVSGGNLTVNDGIITGGKGGYNQRGGGFHVDGGNVTVNNVFIYQNEAAWGGGVFVNEGNGTFTMNDSHIRYNTSISDGNGWNDAGGVYLDGGVFTINNGSIADNYVTGGKKNGALIANHATFNISGDVVIYDNRDGNTQENLFADAVFGGDASINVVGQLGPKAKIGITSNLNQVFTTSENTKYNDPTKFVSDNTEYKVDKNRDGQLMLVEAGSICCDTEGFDGPYDGEEHGIKVKVFDPEEGATVKYGLSEDSCTMEESPVFTDATDGPVKVYYRAEAYNRNDKVDYQIVNIRKLDSAVETEPIANDLTENDSKQELVKEGVGVNGTMMYAVSDSQEASPEEGWSESVPTAVKAGTYYVWYKVVGDKNYNDTEPQVVSVTVKEKKVDPVTPVAPVTKASKPVSVKITVGDSKVALNWSNVPNADFYKVYGSYCGKKMKLLKTVKGKSPTKVTITKLNGKKLNKKACYKFRVYAYAKDGKLVGSSVSAHVVGKKNAKFTNAKAIKVSKKSYTLKKGKKAKVKPKLVLVNKHKKPINSKHGKKFRYASSNNNIATVSGSGVITAKKAGTCTISVYAINGCEKKITVKVK